MENNQPKTKKLTAAAIAKQEEKKREKIAFNLDNFLLATEICIAVLQVENTSEQVKDKANETLLATLDKILNL